MHCETCQQDIQECDLCGGKTCSEGCPDREEDGCTCDMEMDMDFDESMEPDDDDLMKEEEDDDM